MSPEITAIWSLARALRREGVPASVCDRLAGSAGLRPIAVEALIVAWLDGLDETRLGRALAAQVGARATPVPSPLHVVAPGNLFVATWQLIVEGLLLGAAVHVRVSGRDVDAVAALHELLSTRAPTLASRLTWVAFAREDEPAWGAFLRQAGALVAQGSDAAMASLRARVDATRPGLPMRIHGHRLSLIASAGAAGDWSRVARDVLLADGRGCMAPRVWVVCGGVDAPEATADAVDAACGALTRALPAGRRPVGWEAVWRGHVEQLRFDAAVAGQALVDRPHVAVLGGPAAGSQIDLSQLSPVGRALVVVPGPAVEALAAWLAPLGAHLSTGAVVPTASPERDAALRVQLTRAGCLRVCDAGAMQSPPWCQTSEAEPLGAGWWPEPQG